MGRPLISIPTQTVDDVTGKPVECAVEVQLFMLPAAPGACEFCATKHEPEMPHNAQSLFYQTRFNLEHGRAATWTDAMEHCSDEVRQFWTAALNEHGVDVAGGAINPSKGAG